MVKRILPFVTKVSEILMGIFLIIIIVDVWLGVFFRYVLGNALSWSDELARFLMIWMGFLAASLVLKEGGHMGLGMFRDLFPPMYQKIMVIISDVMIVSFLAVWCWYSLEALDLVKYDITSGLNIRLMWPFLALPVCSALMILQQMVLLVEHIKTPLNAEKP